MNFYLSSIVACGHVRLCVMFVICVDCVPSENLKFVRLICASVMKTLMLVMLMSWCNVCFHFIVVKYHVICITNFPGSTHTRGPYKCIDIGGALSNLCKWHLRPFWILSWLMHKLRGSSTISLDLNDSLNILWSLIVLSSITKKGEIESAFGPLSGFWC